MKIIIAIDNVIYRAFGIVTPLRRHIWRKNAREIQQKLYYQHDIRDKIDKGKGVSWTTKKVLEFLEEESRMFKK